MILFCPKNLISLWQQFQNSKKRVLHKVASNADFITQISFSEICVHIKPSLYAPRCRRQHTNGALAAKGGIIGFMITLSKNSIVSQSAFTICLQQNVDAC